MPGTTTRGFPYVQGADNANTIDETTQALAERCRDEYSEGTFASRPAAGTSTAGRVYYATDTGDYWRDTGSGWRFERATARAAGTGLSSSITIASGTAEVQLQPTIGVPAVTSVVGAYSVVTSGTGMAVQVAHGGRYRFRANVIAGGAGTDRDVFFTVEAGPSGGMITASTESARVVPLYGVATSVVAEEALSPGDLFRVQVTNLSGAALTDVRTQRWAIERVAP